MGKIYDMKINLCFTIGSIICFPLPFGFFHPLGVINLYLLTGGGGDVWLEAGSITLGPLFLDAAINSDVLHADMHMLQNNFLKKHDNKQRKLWFLWSAVGTPQPGSSKQPHQPINSAGGDIRCGCTGGCAFFGNNRNGPRFFKFSRQDIVEGLNVAQYRINGPGEDLGFGQSLLCPRDLVFNVSSYVNLVIPHYDLHEYSCKYSLSSGYTKGMAGQSPLPPPTTDSDAAKSGGKSSSMKQSSSIYSRQLSQHVGNANAGDSTHQFRSLGRSVGLKLPPPREISPGSLSDLRFSAENFGNNTNSNHRHGKMPSSLSLQTELPLHAAATGNVPSSGSSYATTEATLPRHYRKASRSSLAEGAGGLIESRHSIIGTSQDSFHTMVQRTVSLGSEALSEAFYSADEEQVTNYSYYIDIVELTFNILRIFFHVIEFCEFDEFSYEKLGVHLQYACRFLVYANGLLSSTYDKNHLALFTFRINNNVYFSVCSFLSLIYSVNTSNC